MSVKNLGIIGGGQLGSMLAVAAKKLNVKTTAYCDDADGPAQNFCNEFIFGKYNDKKKILEFASKVDIITYEFENIPLETIKFCQKIKSVYPNFKSLEICQDRINEKNFLKSIGVDTVKFEMASSYEEIKQAIEIIGLPAVIKTSRFGYDGKGQKVIYKKEEIEKIVSEFIDVQVIIEKFIEFELEISVIICRDMSGKISAYDPSENIHKNGILVESKVPANISFSTSSDAIILASKIVRNLNYVGVMGIEFFVTKAKKILVNEMAPRVHNSGHWTQTGCIISQFEQHIRAITGTPIGDGRRHSNVLMKNILGEQIFNIKYDSGNSINIYGKETVKHNRKMGHVNIIK